MITILVKCDTAKQCWKNHNVLRRLLTRRHITLDDCCTRPYDTKVVVANKIIVEYVYEERQYNGRLADLAIGFDIWNAGILTRRSKIAVVAAYEHPYPYILKLLNHPDPLHLLSFCIIYDLSLRYRTNESSTTTIIFDRNSGDGHYAIELNNDELDMYVSDEVYCDSLINKVYRGMGL